MFTTLATDRIHFNYRCSPQGEIYSKSVMLPPDVGLFLVDMDWSEDACKRVQGIMFPATVEGVARMYLHNIEICDVMFIPPARHDVSGRAPALRIDGIDAARDPAKRYAQVLLVRDTNGEWHVCEPDTSIDALDDRVQLLRVNEKF